jgi:hypothetical protein
VPAARSHCRRDMALVDDLEGPLELSGDRNFMVTPPELGIGCLSLALRPSPPRPP